MRVGEALSVVGRAAVLLVRHWPTLVVLWLLGWLGSTWVTALAVEATRLDNAAGIVVLALAPVATMTAMVVSLRVLRTSSAFAPAPDVAPATRRARLVASLDGLGPVLIPFLAVYMSQGALRDLVAGYTRDVVDAGTVDIFTHALEGGDDDSERGLPSSGWLMGTIAAVAFALRWLVRRHSRRGQAAVITAAWFGAWIEAVWLMAIVMFVNVWRRSGSNWVETRRVVRGLGDVAGSIADSTGWFAQPLRNVWAEVTKSVGALDKAVLAPLALLTIGAIVYGANVRPPEPAPVPGESVVRSRLAASRLGTRWNQAPQRVAKPASVLVRPLRARFDPLVNGLRLVARAGLTPMMLFCVAYNGSQVAAAWLRPVWRVVIGPRPITSWIAIDPVIQTATDAIAGVAGVALIAAAIERLIAAVGADPRADVVPGSSAEVDEEVDGVVAGDVAQA